MSLNYPTDEELDAREERRQDMLWDLQELCDICKDVVNPDSAQPYLKKLCDVCLNELYDGDSK